MESYWTGLGAALWLGILTSISPCPLATNIAAISYVGNKVGRPKAVLLSGVLYILGRSLAYCVVALLVVGGLTSVPSIANYLQDNMNKWLGPLLLIAGLLLLEIIPLPFSGAGVSEKLQQKVDRLGVGGAALMGIVFALAFCPVSAALFFGSLIPLALKHQSAIVMPSLYGVGAALPVALFALIIAFSANRLGAAFNILSKMEIWARRATAVIIVSVGGYYTYNFTL